jgi:hypothetical protein
MPRKYRSQSPVKRRKNDDSYKRTDIKSPKRSSRRSPEYKNVRNRKNRKYYSDSESDSESDSDDYSSSESETESSESDSEEEYSKRGKVRQNRKKEREILSGREKSNTKGKNSKYVSESEDEELSPRYNEKENKINRISHKENEKIRLNDNKSELNSIQDEESPSDDSSKYKHKKVNIKREQLSSRQTESNDNLNTNSGPPKYRVVSFNGEELTVRKLYTSNIGPKNAAQKAFNKMCDKLNEKMEITVEKFGDNKGKIMTYFFMKQELDPPIEREIGGKKVVYRHKTISC